jgi:hypothetical protein
MRKRNPAAAALVGAIALALGQGAAPAGAEPRLPAPVAAAVKENADLCTEVDGTPDTSGAVKTVDLNADGRPDFVLFVGWIHCAGAASLYGDREKAVTVYAGDAAGGASSAYSDMVYDAKIEGEGAAAKLWLTVTSNRCGKPPAPDFAHENFCDRAIAWNGKTKRFEYAPVSTVRMIQ